MTPDLLSALRETPGCETKCVLDNGIHARHFMASEWASRCDPCLTRLAEAVARVMVDRFPIDAFDRKVTEIVWSSGLENEEFKTRYRAALLSSLLSALRSETPR